MDPRHLSVSMHYADVLAKAAVRIGLDPDTLLAKVGLDRQTASLTTSRMTSSQFSGLLLAFWNLADDEFFGMTAAPCRHGSFTMMAKQAVTKRTLRGVLMHICRFYSLFPDQVQMELVEEESEARFRVVLTQPDLDPDHMLTEFLLMLWHRFPAWLISRQIRLKEVSLAYPAPAHAAEYALIFPCAPRFNAPESALVFSRAQLDYPVTQTEEALREHLKNTPHNWVTRQVFVPQYTRRVLDLMLAREEVGNIRMEDLAAEFHMTTRTLRRKLEDEKTSFQELKDRIRRDFAIEQLTLPKLAVSTISNRLGFSDTAAFSRAFKTWTGISPRTYRKHMGESRAHPPSPQI